MNRVFLDSALWRALAEAHDARDAAAAWLALQCERIEAVTAGVVVLSDPESHTLRRAATWPAESAATPALQAILEQCAEEQCGQLSQHEASLDAAFPLIHDGKIEAMIAISVAAAGADPERVMRELQWGGGWLMARLGHFSSDAQRERSERLREVIHCADAVHEAGSAEDAARLVSTRLAAVMRCDRVSVGFRKGAKTKLVAISHMAIEPRLMNLVRSIEEIMDEATDQEATLCLPGPEEVPPRVTLEHARHRKEHAVTAVMTTVMRADTPGVGALAFERASGEPFTAGERDLAEQVTNIAGPAFALRLRDERWLAGKAVDAAKRQARRLLGPAYIGRKLAALISIALVLAAYFVTGTFRVTADASLEGRVLRTVAAPIDGFVAEAPVRAGEAVKVGQLMCQLDDRDLQLERLALTSRRAQLVLQVKDAEARRERSEVSVLSAQIEQVDAELALIDEQIERMHIVAPFDGIVISGDLTQMLGAAVSRGEELFRIAPLTGFRVLLAVEDRDIEELAHGQSGHVVLTSIPHARFPLTVERMTPSAQAKEGRNIFRVEAQLETDDGRLRPGMEGVAKVEVGERRVVWIWTRGLLDWLRLTLWRFSP